MEKAIDMELARQLITLAKAAEANRINTKKLIAAAKVVADAVEALVPVGVALPRHYSRDRVRSREGSETFLFRGCGCGCDEHYSCRCGEATGAVNCDRSGYLHGDFSAPELVKTDRDLALAFARDVAGGLIGEIAVLVAARADKSEAAAAVLAEAAADLGRVADAPVPS